MKNCLNKICVTASLQKKNANSGFSRLPEDSLYYPLSLFLLIVDETNETNETNEKIKIKIKAAEEKKCCKVRSTTHCSISPESAREKLQYLNHSTKALQIVLFTYEKNALDLGFLMSMNV
jgi:hypothetical protein